MPSWLRLSLLALGLLALLLAALVGLFLARPLELLDQVERLRIERMGAESRFVTLENHRIHYYVAGPADGRPLVLVHGLGARAEGWMQLVPRLLEGGNARIYAIDLLGYGQSDKPRDASFSIEQEAGILRAFAGSQHLDRFDLAGWSMGGWVSLYYAQFYPGHVRRLILCDAAGLVFDPDFGPDVFTPDSPQQLDRLQHLLSPHPRPVPGFLARALVARVQRDGWVVRRAIQSIVSDGDVMDGQLGHVDMPVLLLWGREDRLTPLSLGQQFHRLLPQSRLAILDGCGHGAPAECADREAPLVRAFLEAEPPLPAGIEEIPEPAR